MAEVLRAFGAEHVLHVDGAAGVVSDDVAPQALLLDALEVLGLTVVELGLIHGAGAVVGQVELGGDRGVDLPDVVRVQTDQLDGRRRTQHLVGVQAVGAQGSRDGVE
ncbi:hypothetical protein FQZ97_951200 [compost metagenome]